MADLKISQLPNASTPLAGTEMLPIVQAGVTDKVTVDNLLARLTAAPPAIGTTTPAAGSFTTLAASGSVTLGDATTDTVNIGNGGIIKDASGRVGIGATPNTGETLNVSKSITGATSAFGIRNYATVASDVTVVAYANLSEVTTANAAFTLGNLVHYQAAPGAKGAASTITNQYGFSVSSGLTAAINNYAFYGNLAAGTNRYNFYAAGSAQNIFNGDVLVTGAAAALGYGAGAGGTVTQATSKTTTVTLNKPCGQITMHNAALAAGGVVAFQLTNSLITATDVILVMPIGTFSSYRIDPFPFAGGTVLRVTNFTGGSLSEAVVINFAVIKGSTT